METQTQKGAIEAIIFASGEPIPLEKIAAAMELGKTETKALVAAVMEAYKSFKSMTVTKCVPKPNLNLTFVWL